MELFQILLMKRLLKFIVWSTLLPLIFIVICCFIFNYLYLKTLHSSFCLNFYGYGNACMSKKLHQNKKGERMELMKHQHSTLNERVCFTFIQYARYCIKWIAVVVLIVSFQFFRMLPKKLQMKLHKKVIKKAGVVYLGHNIFYQPFF